MAEQLEKDRSTVSKWSPNKIQPDLVTLSKIAGLLNVDIRELLNNKYIKYGKKKYIGYGFIQPKSKREGSISNS